MPLYPDALRLIRINFQAVAQGQRVRPVVIGVLTDAQRDAINNHRVTHNPDLQPIVNEIVFVGAHIYKRRIATDGYTIDDVLEQIESALASDAAFVGGLPMQTIASIHPRKDRLGNVAIRDQAVFECTARRPTAELFSVIPKGDKIRPGK